MNPFLSFKGRLLLFTLCISFLPITIITTIYYFHARGMLRHSILDHLKGIAKSRENHVLSLIERMQVRTVDFSTDRFLRNSLDKIVRGGTFNYSTAIRLNRYLSMNKLPLSHHLIAAAIVDRYGKVVSSTNERLVGKDISGQDLFIQGIGKSRGETYVGQPLYSSDLNAYCICISAPIISRQGTEKHGIIMNAYSLSSLNEVTKNRIGLGESGEVYLVSRDKLIFTESRFAEDTLLKRVVDTEPVRKIAEHGKAMVGIYRDYRGMRVVGASANISEYGWILLAEIDEAEAFAPLKTLSIVVLVFGLVGAGAVTSLGIHFAISMSMPIRDLINATGRLAAGDMDYRVKITREDEIGVLARNFNFMAEKLKSGIIEQQRTESALRALNVSLEHRVAERTVSLVKANKELTVEIAERKRIEEDMRKLFNAVEQSSCSVVITDIKGNIEYVNPKFSRVTGYALAEVIRQNPRILKSGEKPSEEYKRLWDTITSGGEWQGEFHNRKKNGEFYWEYASISPVRNAEGVITHFVAIKEDITEHKRADDELREHRDRLESLASQLTVSNKELEAFCYSVSHDLRAPLRSINGFSRALMEEYSDKLNSQGKNYLHRVIGASKFMGQLIDDLLNLSRITRSDMHRKRFDMSALADAIATKLKESEPERQVEFVITKGLLVDGDHHLMRIALGNLLSNALKFTGKRPRARVEFGATEHSGRPAYFVRDNGAGFDMNFANKLFGAFQRLHSTTEFEGTGIGLATVQRIIHRHGGRIWAEGAVDQGATFYFTI